MEIFSQEKYCEYIKFGLVCGIGRYRSVPRDMSSSLCAGSCRFNHVAFVRSREPSIGVSAYE